MNPISPVQAAIVSPRLHSFARPRPLRAALCRFSSAAAICAALSLAAAGSARAVDFHWDPLADGDGVIGGPGTWDAITPLWDPTGLDSAATAPDNVPWMDALDSVAIFGGTGGTVTVSGDFVMESLHFTGGGYALQGGSVELFGATSVVRVENAFDIATIDSNIFGDGFNKVGAGQLNLRSSFNGFSGPLQVLEGRVDFTDDLQLGNAANEIVLDGGRIDYTSTVLDWDPVGSRVITIGAAGGTIGGSRAIRINDDGQITGAGTLVREGTGNTFALDIAAANAGFTGNVVINSGTIEVKNNLSLGAGTGQAIAVNGGILSVAGLANRAAAISHTVALAGGTLGFNNMNGGVFLGDVAVTANSGILLKDFYQNVNRSGQIRGLLSGTGNLDVTAFNGGTPNFSSLLLSNPANTYSGTITINANAQVRAIQGAGAGALGTAAVNLNGGVLGLAPVATEAGANAGFFGRSANSLKIGNGVIGGFDFGAEPIALERTDLTIDFPTTIPTGPGVSGVNMGVMWTGLLNVTDPGSYEFSIRTDDGSMIYVDGQLVVANDFAQGPTERFGSINLTPGQHSIIIKFGQGTGGAAVTASYNGPDTQNVKALLGSVPGSVTNNGPALFAPITMDNAINVTGFAGTTSDIDLAGANVTSTGAITFDPGTNLRVTGVTGFETLTQMGDVVLAGDNRITTGITLIGNLANSHQHQSSGADVVISGTISGNSGFIKDGPRTLTLTGANTFTGTIDAQGGTLVGNTLAFNQNTIIGLPGGTVVFHEPADATYFGALDSAGAFQKTGAGTFTIAGPSAATGTFTVVDGALQGSGFGGTVVMNPGTALNLVSGSTFLTGGLTLNSASADVTLGSPTLTPLVNTQTISAAAGRVNIEETPGFGAGIYRLFDYAGSPLTPLEFGQFQVGATPGGDFFYTLANNAPDTAIDLSVEAFGALNTWTGGTDGVWDTTTAGNWSDGLYADGQRVTFADGPTNRNITGGAVSPQQINVTADSNYTIANAITGIVAGGIQKSGAGTATFTGPVSTSGATNVTGGTLKLTNTSLATPNEITGVVTIGAGAVLDASFGGARAASPGPSGSSALGGGTVSLDGGTLILRGEYYDDGTGGLTGQYYNQQVQRNARVEFQSLSGITALFNTSTPETTTGGFTDTIGTVDYANANYGGGAPFNAVGGPGAPNPGVNFADNIMATWRGKFVASLPGTNNYTFLGRSDDGLMVFIDGKLVLDRNNFQGNSLTTAIPVSLTEGEHDIFMAFYEGGGGAGVRFMENADNDPVDLEDLRAAQPFTTLGNTVNWNASSTIAADNTYGVGFGGLLANTPGTTLTTGRTVPGANTSGDGLVRFANTTFVAGGTYTVEAKSDVALGTLADGTNAVELVKTGQGNLILDSSTLSDADTTNIVVESGRLVASNTVAGINPLGSASLVLNGVNTILQFNRSEFVAGAATFNNKITVNENARIETMRHGGAGGDILVGGAGGINVAANKTLTLQATSGANMLVDGGIHGDGVNVLVTSAGDPGQQQAFVLMRAANTYSGNLTIENGANVRLDHANALKTQTYVNVAGNGRLEFFAANTFDSNSPRIFSRPGSFFRLNPTANPSPIFASGTFDVGPGRIVEFQSSNGYSGAGTFRHSPGAIFQPNAGNLILFRDTTTLDGLRGSDMRPFDLVRVTQALTGAGDFVTNSGWGSTTPGTIFQIFNGDRNLSVTNVQEVNGQLITNDGVNRSIVDGNRLDIGLAGVTIAASAGTTLTVLENLQTDPTSGPLTIGAHVPLEGRFSNGTVVFAHGSTGDFTGTIESADKAARVIAGSVLEGRVSQFGSSGLGTDASVAIGVALDRGTLRASQPATPVSEGFVTIGKVFATGAGTLAVNRSGPGVVTEMRLATPIARDAGATITLHAQNGALGGDERIRFVDHFDGPARVGLAEMVAPHYVSLGNNFGSFVDYDPAQDFVTGVGFTEAIHTAVNSAAELSAADNTTIADITSAFAMTADQSVGAARLRSDLGGNFTLTSDSGGFIITSDANPAPNLTVASNLAAPAGTEMVVFSGGVAGGIHSINGTVTSDTGLTKFGPRTLNLAANNSATLTGNITVNEGALTFASDTALGAASNDVVLNGGIIRPTANMVFDRDIIVNNGGGSLHNDGNRDIRLRGTISGEGALTLGTVNGTNGITRLQQSGANTFAGGLIVSAGTVEFSRANQLGAPLSPEKYDSGQVVLAEAGGTNAALRLATGAGTVTTTGYQFNLLGNPRFDVAGASDRLVIDDVIRGTGGFTKGGAGTLVLSAPLGNGYSGTTTVAVGALIVASPAFSATGSGPVNVNGGATLAGTGTIDGALTGTAGSIISPGASLDAGTAGLLRTEGGLVLQSDAIYKWSLAALSTENPGVDYDRLTVENSSLTITSGADFRLDFGPGIAPSGDAFWLANRVWEDVIQVTGPGTIASAGFFDIDDAAYQAFGSFSLINDENGYDLVWTAIPEPGSAILLLGGVALAASGRRRRR